MNTQSTKKILFNKSTLLSLKAELYKKKEEVKEKKQLPQNKVENFKPAPSKTSETKEEKPYKPSLRDKLKQVDVEELEACRKSKLALEKKAELYEHLADGTGTSQLANRFLVDFGTKKQQEKKNREPSPEAEPHGTTAELDDDEEWAEFTDCLGRTRKCLKADLELYQKQDKNLARVLTKEKEKEEQIAHVVEETPPPGDAAEKPLLVQKTNDYLASLREKWEQKERELMAKDSDIHYQDLLFDEARIHGVGYYSFSTEEEERRKQMEDLQARRQETLRAQEEAAEKRRQREALVASRVAAAKAARRARAGLPPEDPEGNRRKKRQSRSGGREAAATQGSLNEPGRRNEGCQTSAGFPPEDPEEAKQDFTKCLLEFLTQQKNEADGKAKEEERRKREEQEKERQKLREAYVREWDVGKDGVESTKKFREMTQEEYVEQQRAKRIEEFAPPQAGHSRRSVATFDNKGRVVDGELFKPKTWSDVRPRLQTPPPPDIGPMTENKGLYFSTAQRETKKTDFKYKNFVKPQEPESIVNELIDDEGDVSNDKPIPGKRKADEGTEFAPPPTYDYYGPTPKHFKSKKPFESDIREAYAQGAKSLETKESSRKIRNEYDFTFE